MERIINLIRYRFFLFAGIFPYLLGQIIAFRNTGALNRPYFFLGFFGILLVLTGVELFNEYFDSKEGGDRIFSPESTRIPHCFFPLGILGFLLAFFIGLYLSFECGWPVLLFSFLGFLGAYFYVGPPLKWAYRGLGELVIALSYGPFMVLGSYYIQTRRVALAPFIVSLIAGLSIFSLAILNEIPDYIQDKLVGKRNIVVRLGKQRAVKVFSLGSLCVFVVLGLGVWLKKIPYMSLASFLVLPLVLNSIKIVRDNMERPKFFTHAVRIAILSYVIVTVSIGISYLRGNS